MQFPNILNAVFYDGSMNKALLVRSPCVCFCNNETYHITFTFDDCTSHYNICDFNPLWNFFHHQTLVSISVANGNNCLMAPGHQNVTELIFYLSLTFKELMWKSYTEDIFLSKLSKLMTPWPGLSLNAIDVIAFLNSDEFIEVWTCLQIFSKGVKNL